MRRFEKYIRENYKEEAQDISTQGCVSGCASDFIYYTDTTEFHDKHTDEIWDWLYEEAYQEGLSILTFVGSFWGSGDVGSHEQFKNLLVWAYVEEIARRMVDEQELIKEGNQRNGK